MLAVKNLTKHPVIRLPFEQMADKVLGPRYDLSLVFIGRRRSRRLNHLYRSKDRPTNILSFPLDRASGEIMINLEQVAREAARQKIARRDHLRLIFIHGLLHLKGWEHGSKMEWRESQLAIFFKHYEQKHRHRTRHRQRPHSRRRL